MLFLEEEGRALEAAGALHLCRSAAAGLPPSRRNPPGQALHLSAAGPISSMETITFEFPLFFPVFPVVILWQQNCHQYRKPEPAGASDQVGPGICCM
jgi:hypothetical protein